MAKSFTIVLTDEQFSNLLESVVNELSHDEEVLEEQKQQDRVDELLERQIAERKELLKILEKVEEEQS